MKKRDLMGMCLQNLMRRKARTFLTVLGVVIGSCAIIIMISIGIGMKESQEKLLSQMGDLTIISVTPAGRSKQNAKLDDKALREIKALPGVTLLTPRATMDDVTMKIVAGKDKRYVAEYPTIVGLEPGAIPHLGYQQLDTAQKKEAGGVLVGEYFAYAFMDTKRPDGHNTVDRFNIYRPDGSTSKLPKPYIDWQRTPMELVITVGEGQNQKTLTQPLVVAGRLREDFSRGMETGEGMLMPIKEMLKLQNDIRRLQGNAKKAPTGYNMVQVKVRDIQAVAAVESAIKQMGFSTSSMESIRKPMEKEAQQKQMMLGGLGGISLIVAALGITNTMIMSISERTREIGVMKALGCFVKDIRAIFLLEAGCIGLMGGLVGILISSLISIAMNLLQSGTPPASFAEAMEKLQATGSRISVIPLWLLGFSLVFSILIGVGSGSYPANKAVRISALEAIKHD